MDEADERRVMQGAQATALSTGNHVDVRALVRGVSVEPAAHRGNDA